ncbi:MAG: efflux RND transporter periplasmic adaptor subunit [Gammaproteobacteria bacterium]|nr:efflux RND transporter periplasmic adaptor subunit [Gammaproteobacteria bacterium]
MTPTTTKRVGNLSPNGGAPSMTSRHAALVVVMTALAACDQIDEFLVDDPVEEEQVALYQSAPVQRRNITVAVEAAGVIEPVKTVEVKSKASGEILELPVDTGDFVEAGTLLARIDRRVLNNSLEQAKASLEVAKARQANTQSQLDRIVRLYEQESLSKVDYEQSLLEHATARSEVVRGEIQVENATIQLEDADVNSPIAGTVIERLVEQGQVISSPLGDVGGGTLLMQMADLSRVQVRMLVDEIDIGKVQPGTIAEVNVAAYPNRPFEGEIVKVEPQAVAEQNVTMFPVLIELENREGLLKPGMNAEVEVVMARRESVMAIPTAALRTPKDIHVAGSVLGLDAEAVDGMLDASPVLAGDRAPGAAPEVPALDRERVRAAFLKRRNGEELTEDEETLLAQARQQMGGRRGARATGRPGNEGPSRRSSVAAAQLGGNYMVFALRGGEPAALRIRTGITDLDHAEVVAGLDDDDNVLILPSASLVRAQESFQRRVSGRVGIPGLSQQGGRGND